MRQPPFRCKLNQLNESVRKRLRTRVAILKSAFAGSRLPQNCPACGKADPDSQVVVTSFTLFSNDEHQVLPAPGDQPGS
ncbi:MAG: hypothetical protein ACAI44_20555 [Candidatus Sericytochromatia bacterium]